MNYVQELSYKLAGGYKKELRVLFEAYYNGVKNGISIGEQIALEKLIDSNDSIKYISEDGIKYYRLVEVKEKENSGKQKKKSKS